MTPLGQLPFFIDSITTRSLLLSAIAQRSQHAGQVKLTISSTHGARDVARRAYLRIAGFLERLRKNAEQSDPLQRWYCILSEALRHFLLGGNCRRRFASNRRSPEPQVVCRRVKYRRSGRNCRV